MGMEEDHYSLSSVLTLTPLGDIRYFREMERFPHHLDKANIEILLISAFHRLQKFLEDTVMRSTHIVRSVPGTNRFSRKALVQC
mmetsp:Transcript_4520/g.8066  ORF Transcript_4520/g.8066 Transcript_4520/m.8066 type:complete len:84 (+) Transcript_4520:387-638(+)